MKKYEMPVFIVNGFLDSGKTTFIKNVINQNQFSEFKSILIIECEQGETAYEEEFLNRHGIHMVIVEEKEFTARALKELEKKYHPWAVMIEYNPMWKSINVDPLQLPDSWEVYQQITIIDASTFELYRKNMKSIISETLKNVDMVLFNRCKNDMNLSSYRRSAKALSSGVQIILEHEDGTIIPLAEQLPYSLSTTDITVEDDDYGIWYLDIMERPEQYNGKIVNYKGKIARLRKAGENYFAAGRMVMTCCADDTQFLGHVCKYEDAELLIPGDWVQIEAEVCIEYRDEYRKNGPVMHIRKIKHAAPPKEDMIYF